MNESKNKPVRNSSDWHTPTRFTDLARDVMGSIDLDPFTSVQANVSVRADRILTEADNALECAWSSSNTDTVWMNPPYGRGVCTKAVDKFLVEYANGSFRQAIVLMNSSTDTQWFHKIARAASAICFTRGRISFHDAGGKKISNNTRGQVFFYFGDDQKRFCTVFHEVGAVMLAPKFNWKK